MCSLYYEEELEPDLNALRDRMGIEAAPTISIDLGSTQTFLDSVVAIELNNISIP